MSVCLCDFLCLCAGQSVLAPPVTLDGCLQRDAFRKMLKGECHAREADVKTHSEELKSLTEQLEEKDYRLAELEEMGSAWPHSQELKHLRDQLQDKSTRLAELEAKGSSRAYTEDVESLREQLQSRSNRVADLEKFIAVGSVQGFTQKEELKALTEELEAKSRRLTELEAEVRSMVAELDQKSSLSSCVQDGVGKPRSVQTQLVRNAVKSVVCVESVCDTCGRGSTSAPKDDAQAIRVAYSVPMCEPQRMRVASTSLGNDAYTLRGVSVDQLRGVSVREQAGGSGAVIRAAEGAVQRAESNENLQAGARPHVHKEGVLVVNNHGIRPPDDKQHADGNILVRQQGGIAREQMAIEEISSLKRRCVATPM